MVSCRQTAYIRENVYNAIGWLGGMVSVEMVWNTIQLSSPYYTRYDLVLYSLSLRAILHKQDADVGHERTVSSTLNVRIFRLYRI